MHSILLIANGPAATSVADLVLRNTTVVVTCTTEAHQAASLLTGSPFDGIVCAIDGLDVSARRCIDLLENVAGVPTVIVTGVDDLPLRSFDIDTRIVPISEGVDEVAAAVDQQFRRIPTTATESADADCEFEFSFGFKAEPARIGKARAVAGGFIQRCLGLDERELLRIELVLEEALANAVYHGSLEISSDIRTGDLGVFQGLLTERLSTAPYSERQVHVELAACENELRITVSDEGHGFDISQTVATGDENAIHQPSGRGLLLMHAFADSVEFNETGNSVQLRKKRSSMQCADVISAFPQTQAVLPVPVSVLKD